MGQSKSTDRELNARNSRPPLTARISAAGLKRILAVASARRLPKSPGGVGELTFRALFRRLPLNRSSGEIQARGVDDSHVRLISAPFLAYFFLSKKK